MKNLYYSILFLLFLGLNNIVFSQVSYVENTSHNSTQIIIPNTQNQLKRIHIFTKSSEDTIVFKEDFSKLPKAIIGYPLGGYNVSAVLPNSYTDYSGCQAQNIASCYYKLSTYNDTCYLVATSGNPSSSFTTSFLDLSKSNNSFRLSFKNIKYTAATTTWLYVLMMNENGEYDKIDSIQTPSSGETYYNRVFNNGIKNTKIRFQINSSSGTKTTMIDDILITYPSIINNHLSSSPIETNDTLITINNLLSNTKYNYFIEGLSDTLSFTTKKEINQSAISKVTPNSATVKYNSSISQPKLILKQKSNNNTIVAEDLFISEYLCTSDNKGLEIYNGTGETKCLKDYIVRLKIATSSSYNYSFNKLFYAEDSIDNNESIIISMTQFKNSLINNNINYIYEPLYEGTSMSLINITGNDAFILLKNNIPIDIFGDTNTAPATYWESTNSSIKTNATIIKRKSHINKGSDINYNTSVGAAANKVSAFLTNEWDLVYSGTSPSYADLAGAGSHFMDNALGSWDSLVGVYTLNSGLVDLGNGNYQYVLDNLLEDTYYETYLMVVENGDTNYSNTQLFKTGKNTLRTLSGNWNDTNWTKGVPDTIDNVIIPTNQELIIPNGVNAKANTIYLRDGLGDNKAELKIQGSLEYNNAVIEADFNGYTNNLDGWNLFSLPINPLNISQDTIGQVYFNTGNNDDLYYWQEDYTDTSNLGRWVNYKSIPEGSGDFFKTQRGYLVSYNQNKKLEFEGRINDSASYTLLDNASLSLPNSERGWHLCANPYPFTLSIDNFNRTNVSNPSLLDPQTLNYTTLDVTDPTNYKIPPYSGFFVQVANQTNNLSITKEGNGSKATINPSNFIEIKLISDLGVDKTKVLFIQGTSYGFDVEYDNRKLEGYGNISEIATIFNNENYSINAIEDFEDSLKVDLKFTVKVSGVHSIKLNIKEIQEYNKILLYDKTTNTILNDFIIDSIFSTNLSLGEYENYQLIIKKQSSSIPNEEISQKTNIRIEKDGDKVEVFLDGGINEEILSLELINTKGQVVNKKTKSNWIIIPEKGIYIIRVITNKNQFNRKITLI